MSFYSTVETKIVKNSDFSNQVWQLKCLLPDFESLQLIMSNVSYIRSLDPGFGSEI